jgi:hypothetical protein
VSAAIKRFICASLGRDGRIGSRGPVIFRYNDLVYPGGVINGVQVLFAEIRGYGDYGVAATEFWSQLLYSGQDCSGASPNKQVVISNERKTSFNRFLFFHRDDSIRLGEVCKLWSHARANARDVSFAGSASERDRAYWFDGDNFDPWEFCTKSFRDPGQGTGSAGPNKNPIDFVKFACNLICRLLGMNIFVGYVSILIEPDCVRIRLQYLIDFL